MRRTLSFLLLIGLALAPARAAAPRPLAPADIDDIARLLQLEDTRQFDAADLGRILKSAHPEVRRRAVISVARIVNPGAAALLAPMRTDSDPQVRAAVAFAYGQQKDAAAVVWLSEQMSAPKTPSAIAREAARSLGKIRSLEARAALAKYLTEAPDAANASTVVGEALLSFGRFPLPGDVAPILKWTTSKDVEVRWRAAWALFRPRNPAAIPTLVKLATDPSPDVRFWAVRGFAPADVDKTDVGRAVTSKILRDAVSDKDRRVRTEALRALGAYDDDQSFAVVLAALDSPDSWISVSAAEALGNQRQKPRSATIIPKLWAASAATKPTALRITALTGLVTLGAEQAVEAAASLIHDPGNYARAQAAQALGRLGAPGQAKLDALAADPETKDLVPQRGAGRGGGGGRGAAPALPSRPIADYRALVEKWIVSDYNGAKRPRTIWTTPKGEIEMELYPGDAPLALEQLIRLVESGSIVGTEFTRVVPNFVDQMATIRDATLARDEVNQQGLTRANLAWATAGLDTGRPGYTIGNTPQPHNEGDFTSLGRVVRGMDVADRIELGDKITAAKMAK